MSIDAYGPAGPPLTEHNTPPRLDRAVSLWRVRRIDATGTIRQVRYYAMRAAAAYRADKWAAAGWAVETHRTPTPVRFTPAESGGK